MKPCSSMRTCPPTVLCCTVAFACLTAPGQARAGPIAYADLDSVLARHVHGDRVDYGALARDRAPLDRFLKATESARPDEWPRDDQIAFWVNVYNARVIEGVLRHPGLGSVLDVGKIVGIPTLGFFRSKRRTAGRDLSLNDIEHEILRKRYAEPRVHFVLNCASTSCPVLPPRALTGKTLDAMLESATDVFLTDSTRNHISPQGPLELSAIFDWYKADFIAADGSVRAFIEAHWSGEGHLAPDLDIRHLDYDWSLNGHW